MLSQPSESVDCRASLVPSRGSFERWPLPKQLQLEDASFADLRHDYRDPSILLSLVDMRDSNEDESFDEDSAFLKEGDIT